MRLAGKIGGFDSVRLKPVAAGSKSDADDTYVRYSSAVWPIVLYVGFWLLSMAAVVWAAMTLIYRP